MSIKFAFSMSLNDLWSLHEQMSAILSARIKAEKHELEKRLAVLNRGGALNDLGPIIGKRRRKYPRVLPKYRNPQTLETWSGRGKRPRSLVAAMKSGRRIEEFRVDQGTSKGWRGVILPSANINPLDSEAPLGSTRSVSAHVRQSNLDEAAMRGINPNGMCQAAASPHGFRSPWKVTP